MSRGANIIHLTVAVVVLSVADFRSAGARMHARIVVIAIHVDDSPIDILAAARVPVAVVVAEASVVDLAVAVVVVAVTDVRGFAGRTSRAFAEVSRRARVER